MGLQPVLGERKSLQNEQPPYLLSWQWFSQSGSTAPYRQCLMFHNDQELGEHLWAGTRALHVLTGMDAKDLSYTPYNLEYLSTQYLYRQQISEPGTSPLSILFLHLLKCNCHVN